MAKAPTKKNSDASAKVTRIKASESSTKKATVTKAKPAIDSKKKEAAVKAEKREQANSRNPLRAIARYFKGSWYELTQVRWPDRKSTWGMTGALVAFTLFFVVVVLLFDYGFAQLFKLILGSN